MLFVMRGLTGTRITKEHHARIEAEHAVKRMPAIYYHGSYAFVPAMVAIALDIEEELVCYWEHGNGD